MLIVGEVRVNHKRGIVIGVIWSWQINMFEHSFVILQYDFVKVCDMDDN